MACTEPPGHLAQRSLPVRWGETTYRRAQNVLGNASELATLEITNSFTIIKEIYARCVFFKNSRQLNLILKKSTSHFLLIFLTHFLLCVWNRFPNFLIHLNIFSFAFLISS